MIEKLGSRRRLDHDMVTPVAASKRETVSEELLRGGLDAIAEAPRRLREALEICYSCNTPKTILIVGCIYAGVGTDAFLCLTSSTRTRITITAPSAPITMYGVELSVRHAAVAVFGPSIITEETAILDAESPLQ